jgi:hypothetical protein
MINDGMFSVVSILVIKNILSLIIGNQKFFIATRFMAIETCSVLVAHKPISSNPKVHLT